MGRWTAPSILLLALGSIPARADDWPQWRGPSRDGIWREEGILEKFPTGGLPVRWRTPIGPGYSGPAVADGRVFIMDRVLKEGEDAEFRLRWNLRNTSEGQERVVCLEEATGKIVWTHSYPCSYDVSYGIGPRVTPTVCGDKVYTLGAMGDMRCLETETGRAVWKRNYVEDFGAKVPLYGFASQLLVDGDRLIGMVGGEGQTVMAFDRHTGKVVWKAVTASEPGYSPPMIFTLGGLRQLVVFHPDGLNGLEPETGKVLWFVPLRVSGGIAISPPAVEGDRMAVSSQYGGSAMLDFKDRAKAPKVLWRFRGGNAPERQWKKAGVSTTMSTVLLRGGFVYSVSLYGEFCCLKGETGERVWTTLRPTSGGERPRDRWSTVYMVTHGERVFIFNEKGDLIIAKLTPAGYEELDRTHLIDPDMSSGIGRKVAWSHPAYANRCVYVRNNRELICASLAGK